jgi:DNA recombination protein RmuC
VCGRFGAGGRLGRAQTERTHAEQGARLASEAAAARASLHAERTAAVEREARLEQTDERLRATFAALSADALRTNNQSFLELVRSSLAHYQKQASTDLEQALRTPNVHGGWGKVQLRRVVEMAGMVNHCHFVEKRAAENDEGRVIPDLIVKLPGGAKHCG